MYFVIGRFKNVRVLDQKVLKNVIKDIKDNDILFLFDDGYCLHKNTNKEILMSMSPANTIAEMFKNAKTIFKKCSKVLYKASTKLQYTTNNKKDEIKNKLPSLIETFPKVFMGLVNRGTTKGKHNVSYKLLSDMLSFDIQDTKTFINIAIEQGILRKNNTSYSITNSIWNKLQELNAIIPKDLIKKTNTE